MANIYNIEQELLGIFYIIEENDGEITPELEEALKIKQEEFKDKIKSYVNVIKQFELEIKGIKEEKDRLNILQKRKENTIEKLKDILKFAIMNYGDENKTGSKFIDYGLGKISLRKSESIELDEDNLKVFTQRFISYFNWLKYQNVFEQTELDSKVITHYCNSNVTEDDDSKLEFTERDLSKIQAEFDFKVNLKEIISTESGRNLMRALLDYNASIVAKPAIDKTAIKNDLKEQIACPTFATHVIKQNVIIK